MSDTLQETVFPPPPPPGPARKPWYRRAVVIIPVVVALVAAAVVTTVLVVASSGPVNGTLHPVPLPRLRATVTSALTGKPLPVTVERPGGARVSVPANGDVATNRIKPGDQVSISAEGYVTAQAPVGADRTITATLQPTLATVSAQLSLWADQKNLDAITNWVFSPATGLQFTPNKSMKISGEGPRWWAARDVVGKNATVDATLVEGLIGESETAESLFGKKATQVTIAGQPAWHGPMGHGTYASLWMRRPFIITVLGSDLSTTDAVLAAMISAQPAK